MQINNNPVSIMDIVKEVNGNTIVAITTSTKPSGMRKTIDTDGGRETNPHYNRVQKITTGSSVMVFQNKAINGYDAMVKRRLEKEGKNPSSFQLGPRKWGERLKNLPIVRHPSGQLYLEVIFLRSGETTYNLDGVPIDKSDILGLPTSRQEGEQGGLDDKVIIRTFKVSSLLTIRINNTLYTNIVE